MQTGCFLSSQALHLKEPFTPCQLSPMSQAAGPRLLPNHLSPDVPTLLSFVLPHMCALTSLPRMSLPCTRTFLPLGDKLLEGKVPASLISAHLKLQAQGHAYGTCSITVCQMEVSTGFLYVAYHFLPWSSGFITRDWCFPKILTNPEIRGATPLKSSFLQPSPMITGNSQTFSASYARWDICKNTYDSFRRLVAGL